MSRVYNFAAGPAVLPLPVLQRAASELVEYGSSGMSVMEMSHRTPVYEEIIGRAEKTLREVMGIPDNYKVLFLQGGATLQFAGVPMNLLPEGGHADYAVTGQFAKKAFDEAKKYGEVKCIASSEDKKHTYIPKFGRGDITPGAAYVHVCFNNTMEGTCFDKIPDTGDVPLVADMSSCILSRPYDVSKFGLIYAGAQKNMGPSGLTVVIVRDDLIGKARKITPSVADYKTMADNESMLNTPPCYSIYIAGLVFEWLRDQIGGLAKMEAVNVAKANLLYDYLDSQTFYKAPAEKAFRSIMNVTYFTGDEELDKKFCKQAAAAGIENIKGHRAVGGMRASIYNAMPTEGVQYLVDFMKKFAGENK